MKNCLWLSLLLPFFICPGCRHGPGTTDHPAYFSKVIDSARHLFAGNKPEQATHFLDSAYNAFPGAGPGDLFKKYALEEDAFLNLVAYHQQKKEYLAIALACADSMLQVTASAGTTGKYAKEKTEANFAMGDVLFDMGRYDEAYKYFYTGKLLAAQAIGACERSGFISRLASICYKQGKYREAAGL